MKSGMPSAVATLNENHPREKLVEGAESRTTEPSLSPPLPPPSIAESWCLVSFVPLKKNVEGWHTSHTTIGEEALRLLNIKRKEVLEEDAPRARKNRSFEDFAE